MCPSNSIINKYIHKLGLTVLVIFIGFLMFLLPAAYAGQGIITGSSVNVRSGPGVDYEIIGSLLKDTQVEVLECAGSFNKIKYASLQGWVASEYINTAGSNTAAGSSRQIKVINGPINVRSGPATTFPILDRIADQAIYKVLSETDGWYQIQLNEGQKAYVAGWLVQEIEKTADTGTTTKPSNAASAGAPTVIFNQQTMRFEVLPRIENGRALVPLRAIFEAMGASVNWNESTRTITARNASTTVMMTLGSTKPTVNGQIWTLEVPAKIVNGRTLAPLRFVGEAFGGQVNWDAQNRIITINYTAKNQPAAVTVKEAQVNLRMAPSTSANIADIAAKGETMTVLSEQNGWYQVKHGNVTAWVASWVVEAAAAPADPGTSAPTDPETPVVDPATPNPSTPGTSNEPENALHLSRTRDGSGIRIMIRAKVKMNPNIKQSSGCIQYEFTDQPLVGLNYFEESAGSGLIKAKASSQDNGTLISLDFPSELECQLSVEDNGKKLIAFIPNTLLGIEKNAFGSVGDRYVLSTLCPVSYTGKLNGDELDVSISNLKLKKGASYNFTSDLVNSMEVKANPSKPSDLLIRFNTSNMGKYSFATSGKNADLNIILMKKTAVPVRTQLVVLDAGHGGNDTGARGSLIDEKEVNLAVVLKAGELLKQKGIKVAYTRADDSAVDLEERSNIANRLNAEIFISVHSNANTQSAPNGTETYFYAPLENPDLYVQREERSSLAALLQNQLISRLQRNNRGVKEANFSVLRNTEMPSALIEMAFISNPDEQALLIQEDFQNDVALAIATAIEQYMNQ